MSKFITTIAIVLLLILPAHAEVNEDHIYLNFSRKEVCSNRARKCWPVALGNSTYPTPMLDHPVFLLTHYKNGFNWRNPFTGVVYRAGTHNLGNIWIQYTTRKGVDIGFHQTPYPSIPIRNQESKGGCIRMTETDIKEFSEHVRYLDKIYSISQPDPITYK